MKKLINSLAATAFFALAAVTTPAMAGGGGGCHFHGNKPAEKETVVDCAIDRKEALIKSGKLESSWKAVKQDNIVEVDGKKGKEWKVSFKDPAAKDKSKETLYMYFTSAGNFLAANFTGQ